MQTKRSQAWGLTVYIAGFILALLLALAAIWADFEAVSYFYTGAAYATFPGLKCPVIMTTADTAQIRATFDNPTDKAIEPFYQVKISGPLGRSFEKQITLPPHSSMDVRWAVTAADADLEWFVMTKIIVLPFAGNPAREAACGMMLFNLGGLTSVEVLPWVVALSLLALVLGLTLREGTEQAQPGREATLRNGMRAAAVAVLLAMLTGFLGIWLVGLIFSAISILLAVILFRIGSSG